jgi:hypothetical protein
LFTFGLIPEADPGLVGLTTFLPTSQSGLKDARYGDGIGQPACPFISRSRGREPTGTDRRRSQDEHQRTRQPVEKTTDQASPATLAVLTHPRVRAARRNPYPSSRPSASDGGR